MDHLETRQLRYFVAVAEEQHFGRAAQRIARETAPYDHPYSLTRPA